MLFSNTKFLTEIKDEQSTRNKLKHLLVLLTRLLAVFFLVMAFAQPFIPSNKTNTAGEKLISVYLDNSFSMQTEGKGYLLFDEAKTVAQKVIEAYGENNKFQILTNDFEAKHQRIVGKSEVLNMLSDVKVSAAKQNKDVVLEKQKIGAKKFEGDKIIYQLSDFQKQNTLFEADSNLAINLIQFEPTTVRNISIEEVWFEAPVQLLGQNNKLLVKIRNQSEEEQSGSFQLSLNGVAKSIGNYTIKPYEFIVDTIQFTIAEANWNKGKITINDYPLTFDDTYFFSFFVEKQLQVYTIFEGTGDKFPKAVFFNNEQVAYESTLVGNIDYNKIQSQHLVVLSNLKTISTGLSDALRTYLNSGGQVLFIPNGEGSIQSYNQFLSAISFGAFTNKSSTAREITNINLDHDVLKDIFDERPNNISLPMVNEYYVLNRTVKQETILSFADGSNYLSSASVQNGNLYVLSSALGEKYSDFTQQAVFAPIIYKMAVLGAKNVNISYMLAANTTITLDELPENTESLYRISNEQVDIIPQKTMYNGQVSLNLPGDQLESGFYTVAVDDEDYAMTIALNYDRTESDLTYFSTEELKSTFFNSSVKIIENNLVSIQENVKQLEEGKSFWKLCIILALIFLALEILLLRFLPN